MERVRKEVSDNLKAAEEYLKRLKILEMEVQNAENQIKSTAEETETNINITFSNLVENVATTLSDRRDLLIHNTRQMETEGLLPLAACRSAIAWNIENTMKFINDGESLGKINDVNRLEEFNNKASLLGNLPEVPELKDVPYVSFQIDAVDENTIINMCNNFGFVCQIAPIQISMMTEKPGAILVEWMASDNSERVMDIEEFCLQRAYGNVHNNKHLFANFKNCYRGIETQFLVKDLRPNQPYSFRVCCKYEGSPLWSPWSLAQIFSTSLKPYRWKTNEDFVFADDNKIAKAVIENPSLLLSDGPQFSVGYSVEFTFLESEKIDEQSWVGLITSDNFKIMDTLESHECFVINGEGLIFIDGSKKSTQLPEIKKGTKVTFSCESLNNNKVRVNIDSCEKRVTYDWTISTTTPFYFAAKYGHSQWKIMVE